MISQTALRSGYHTANMVTQITSGQFESCDVSWHYTQPNAIPDANPDTTTALSNLATATGANRATVAALTKSLAEMNAVTKAEAEELRRMIHSGHIDPFSAQTQHGSATVARGNGRQRCVKLLPLPHPPVRSRTDARINPSAQRATQLRSVLARVYTVSIQNQITTTVP
jgi:hypothetical protein